MTPAEQRLIRWRDVGDGPITYVAGDSAFGDDVRAVLSDLTVAHAEIERLKAVLAACVKTLKRDEIILGFLVERKEFAKWINHDGIIQDPYGVHANLEWTRTAIESARKEIG